MMDERLWSRSADACELLSYIFPMTGHNSAPPQSRKSRLYYIALGRLIWQELPPASQLLLDAAERLTEGQLGADLLTPLSAIAERLTRSWNDKLSISVCEGELAALGLEITPQPGRLWSEERWHQITWLTFFPFWRDQPPHAWVATRDHRADLVRCIFGNPFVSIHFHSKWRTPSVVGLAKSIEEMRSFEKLPVLADALQEADCHDQHLLDHCRDDHLHARGCCVLDAVLDRREPGSDQFIK